MTGALLLSARPPPLDAVRLGVVRPLGVTCWGCKGAGTARSAELARPVEAPRPADAEQERVPGEAYFGPLALAVTTTAPSIGGL